VAIDRRELTRDLSRFSITSLPQLWIGRIALQFCLQAISRAKFFLLLSVLQPYNQEGLSVSGSEPDCGEG
jgi:hypothetical protein